MVLIAFSLVLLVFSVIKRCKDIDWNPSYVLIPAAAALVLAFSNPQYFRPEIRFLKIATTVQVHILLFYPSKKKEAD